MVKMFLNFLHTGTFDTEAEQYWDKFYEMHQNKFFKDRKWLFLEFPELLPSKSQATTRRQGDQQTKTLLPTGTDMESETRHCDHRDASPQHTRTSDYPRACQGVSVEKNEDDIHTPSFPGQHASFRILEVYKNVHIHFHCFDILLNVDHYTILYDVKKREDCKLL